MDDKLVLNSYGGLWVTDCTDTGTYEISDVIYSGYFAQGVNKAFFRGKTAQYGSEIWVTDATSAGTFMAKDLDPTSKSSNPHYFYVYDDVVYFFASSENFSTNYEPYRTDGTSAGTYILKDIYPGNQSSCPRYFTEMGGYVYFGAGYPSNGNELWRTDGTEAGTELVKDIRNGSENSSPSYLVSANNKILFSAREDATGTELYISDGTEAGTHILKDIAPASASSFPHDFIAVDNLCFFEADDGINGVELWVTDGTETGTHIVKNLSAGAGNSELNRFINGSGTLFFTFDDGNGEYLYKSDGTEDGTVAITGSPKIMSDIVIKGKEMIFNGRDNIYGDELWKYYYKEDQFMVYFDSVEDKAYGDSNFYVSAGANTGLPISYLSSDINIAQPTDSLIHLTGGGDITLYAYQKGNAQYFPTDTLTRSFNVAKVDLTVTVEDTNKLYGQQNPAFTINYNGFVLNDSLAMIDTLPTAGTIADITSDTGIYPVQLSGGFDNAYNFIFYDGELTINKKGLNISVNDTSKTYGNLNPEFFATYDGFVLGQDTTVLDTMPLFLTTATQTSDAGTYDITLTGGNDNNYSYILENGELTIDKANLLATADDKSKTYGDINPAFTTTYTGFVLGQDTTVLDTMPSISSSASQSSDAGIYDVELSGGSDNNYDLILTNGELTINKANLTITAEDKARAYGEPNPVFTLLYNGFVLGQDSTVIDTMPIITCNATDTRSVGIYDIFLTGGADNNYEFTLQNGLLTINKALATLIIDSLEHIWDGNPKEVVITTIPEGLNSEVTYDGSFIAPSDSGTYLVEAIIMETNYEGSETANMIILPNIGIEEIANYKLLIYPNPAIDRLNIDLGKNNQEINLMIIDPKGRLVEKNMYSGGSNIELDVSRYAKGTYILKIQTKENVLISTFQKP